jgi:hypothetical protein
MQENAMDNVLKSQPNSPTSQNAREQLIDQPKHNCDRNGKQSCHHSQNQD